MKARKEHQVPLSNSAVAIIKAMPAGEFLFANVRNGKPLSQSSMIKVLRRAGIHGQFVTNGFRSAFRDWGAELGDYPNEILELAIAHAIGDKAEAAYRRGVMLAKRHTLMADWERYCNAG